MIGENEQYIDMEELEVWRTELINRLVPDKKINCIGFYEERVDPRDPEFHKKLFDCKIIEIVTNISINTEKFKDQIIKAGYRLLDVMYGSDNFKFLIQKKV